MNLVFLILILIAYSSTVWQQFVGPAQGTQQPMDLLTQVIFQSADDAITLSMGLIGVMTFFLGLMKVAENSGLLNLIAYLLAPVLSKLFPDVPKNHPAHGAIVMNMSANMLGLGNAATPFGIKAMRELENLNPHPGIATNAMVLFLAINTSSVTLIPTKVIALRAAAGSQDPAGIIMTTLFATVISTLTAVIAALTLQRFFMTPALVSSISSTSSPKIALRQYLVSLFGIILFLSLIPLAFFYGEKFGPWVIPSLTVGILAYGYIKKVPIYEVFTEGATEGFWTAVRIMPYLAAILVAIGLLKVSGSLEAIINFLSPFCEAIGIPAQVLPMVFMRSLSGSGSLGILSSMLNDPNITPDSSLGYLVSTMMGCTETTFYVIAVYYGAIQIKKIRHTLWVGLIADLSGMFASVWIVRKVFGM